MSTEIKSEIVWCNTPSNEYDDILFWLNFDHGSWSTPNYTMDNGSTEYSVGDAIGTINSAAIVSAGSAHDGNGLDCPTGADYMQFSIAASTYGDIIDTEHGSLGFWIYFTAIDTASTRQIFLAAGASGIRLYTLVTGEIQLAHSSRSVATSGAGLTTGNWYFVEAHWDTNAETYSVEVNGASAGSGTSTIAPVDCSGGAQFIQIGNVASTTANDLYIDQFVVSNDPARDLYALCVTSAVVDYPG